MLRAIFKTACVTLPLSILGTGLASPKSDAFGPGVASTPAKSSSWTDTVTSPFKKGAESVSSIFASKPAEPSDPLSLKSGTPKPSAELFTQGAHVYETRNNSLEAVNQYQAALKVDPNYVPAILGLAHLKDRQGASQEALGLYERAVKANPKDAAAQNDLGICQARIGMTREATLSIAKAVELQPDKKLYRNNLAHLLVEQQRLPEAYAQLRAAHGDAVAHFNMGYLLQQRGQTQVAIDEYAQALRLDPNMQAAQQMLDKIGGTMSVAQRPAINESRPAYETRPALDPLPPVTPVSSPSLQELRSHATPWQEGQPSYNKGASYESPAGARAGDGPSPIRVTSALAPSYESDANYPTTSQSPIVVSSQPLPEQYVGASASDFQSYELPTPQPKPPQMPSAYRPLKTHEVQPLVTTNEVGPVAPTPSQFNTASRTVSAASDYGVAPLPQ